MAPDGSVFHYARHRLEAFREGRSVDVPVYLLPSWARADVDVQRVWRAVVDADDTITFRGFDARRWLEEKGCRARLALLLGWDFRH